MPEHVTMNWWKEERGERIFIDFNQMARDRTIASAYSVRANPRATVSAPLRWDEVPRRRAGRLRRDHHAGPVRRGRRPARRGQHRGRTRSRRCWRCPTGTRPTTARATCRIRRSTRRCRASPSGSSPAGTPVCRQSRGRRVGTGPSSRAEGREPPSELVRVAAGGREPQSVLALPTGQARRSRDLTSLARMRGAERSLPPLVRYPTDHRSGQASGT